MISRAQGVDALKGMVMVLMVLDHVRMYFHEGAYIYHPLDLENTNVAVFLTRYITHICAPVFILLAGVSTYMVSNRMPNKLALAKWLAVRGLVILLIELSLINTAWFFNIKTDYFMLGVLWAIGLGMLSLGLLLWLPRLGLAAISLALILFHNLFDGHEDIINSVGGLLWYFLHIENEISLAGIGIYNGYPLIPSIAVLWLGYCIGPIFSWPKQQRIRCLGISGLALIAAFIPIRAFTEFGDYWPWEEYPTIWQTALSFIDVHKTPHSLLFLMLMLGFAGLILAAIELKGEHPIFTKLKVFGRVPLFFYIVHIYLIHALAMLFATIEPDYQTSDMIIRQWISEDQKRTANINRVNRPIIGAV